MGLVFLKNKRNSIYKQTPMILLSICTPNLLMPEAKIRELYSGGFSMEEMAYFLNVSKIAMGHRLEYLGLIDE